MIRIDRLTVRYGERLAVDDVSASVATGEWLALVGANGAGKTTLLRAVVHLEAYSGDVVVGGRAMGSIRHRQRARLVAYLPQAPELPADMPVGDYVLLGRTPHISYFGVDTARDREICAHLLERLDLDAMADRPLRTLSGGELQRLLLARVLAQDAPVLLLDEPTSALDLGRRVAVLDLVDELRRERRLTVVSALHDLTLAAQFADRLLLMSEGRLVVAGTPAEVLTEDTLSRQFGGPIRVLRTEDGEIVVAPRRPQPPPVSGT